MDNIFKGFIKAFFILVVICTILFSISYNAWKNEGFSDDLNLSDYFEEEKHYYPQVTDNKKEIAKELYKKINYKFVEENFGTDFYDEYYENEDSDFSSEFMIYLAIINLEKDSFMTECNNKIILSSDVVDNKIQELFGTNATYENKSYENKEKTFAINYLSDSSTYEVVNTSCSGIEFQKNYIETEFFDSKQIDKNLIVTEITYYTSYTLKVDGSYVLNYHSGLTPDSNIIYNSNMTANIDKNKFTKYNYIFVEISPNKYYLSKIEKEEK